MGLNLVNGMMPAVKAAFGSMGAKLFEYLDNGAMCCAEGTLSTAQVLALFTTPVSLIAAPGSGKYIEVVGCTLRLVYNSTAYDGIAAGEDILLSFTDGSGQVISKCEATGFLDATANAVRHLFVGTGSTLAQHMTPVDNAAVVISLLSGNVATGNSPIKYRIFYRIRKFSW